MVFNPAQEFSEVPANFSCESKIVSIDCKDRWRGIILDSVADFCKALIVYNGGSVSGVSAVPKELLDEIKRRGGELDAVIDLSYEGLFADDRMGFINAFNNILIKEVALELRTSGKYRHLEYRHFEYDAHSCAFYGKPISGVKVGEKYILNLVSNVAVEERLAKVLKKPMALRTASVSGNLSVVDDWWFNVDLEKLLSDLPVSKKKIFEICDSVIPCSECSNDFVFEYNGQKFLCNVFLNTHASILRSKNKKDYFYLESRGTSVVGGAWTWVPNWGKEFYDLFPDWKEKFKVEPPSIDIWVSLPSGMAITVDQICAVQEARNSIAKILCANELYVGK